MWKLLGNLFVEMVMDDKTMELLEWMETWIQDVFTAAFHFENIIPIGILASDAVSQATKSIYPIMVVLLAVRLSWKGFKIYVLWRDGEAETPPSALLTGAVFAIATAVAFPLLYDLAIDLVVEIRDVVLKAFSLSGGTDLMRGVIHAIVGVQGQSVFMALLLVVYLIVMVFAIGQMLFRGLELMVFRIAVPIAVSGLVDSDGGAWKPFAQSFIRQLATVLIQTILVILGLRVIAECTMLNLGLGIIFEIAAFRTPKMLSQFLLPSGGGGGGRTISTLLMVAKSFAGGGA